MVLEKKRKLTDSSRNKDVDGFAKKRKGSKDDDDYYDDNSVFCQLVKKAGLRMKNKFNELCVDQAVFQRDLLRELKRHSTFPDVLDEFIEGFETCISEPKRFHHSLLPCVTAPECDSARSGCQASLIKALLGIDLIQPKLMSILLEKLPEFTEEDSHIIEEGQKVNVPRLLMSQFQWLDRIINGKEVTQKMLEMVSITDLEIQREIITCLPEVVEDTEHGEVAKALRDLLQESSELTVPILDALSNLTLKQDLLSQVRESVLQSIVSVELEDLPVVVKFLLQSVTSQDALEVILELRSNLDLNSCVPSSVSLKKKRHKSSDGDVRNTKALILDAIKAAIRFQKNVAEAWIKVLESVKQPNEHKPLDIFILLILHISNRKKAVESLFRNKIRAGCFTEAYLQGVYKNHSQVLQKYFPSILNLCEVLLRSPEPAVTYFACALYKLTFTTFDTYHQQEIVGNLVTHIGSGFEGEIDSSLDILADLVDTQLTKMAPFAILVKSVLDYLDNLSVSQIRKLYFMLSALAFKNPQEGGLIQDDLHIVIRKQLCNNTPKYQRMGVIGAVMIVKSMCYNGEGNAEEMSEELYRQVVSLLQLVHTSSSKTPEASALLMDEMSAVIGRGHLHSKVEAWVNDNVAADFQDDFVVDKGDEVQCLVPTSEQFGLDSDDDASIIINLLPLIAQSRQKRAAPVSQGEKINDAVTLSPYFRLLCACEQRQSGNLDGIDALLGCSLYMAKEEVYEKLASLSEKEKEVVCTSLFLCINWFIEVVNGFAMLSDAEMKGKVITRLQNITELQKVLEKCIPEVPSFKPPAANFDLDEYTPPTMPAVTTNGKTKEGKGKKGKKTKKKKGEKEKPNSDSDENSRDMSVIENDASQLGTQETDKSDSKTDKSTVSLTNYKPFFRELDIDVFTILNTGLITRSSLDTEMNTKATTELSIQPPQLQFLMEDLCRKLNHSLIASASKRRTFLKTRGDKKIGFSNLDQYTAQEIATKSIQLLPALCNHLEGASGFFQALIAENDGLVDGPGSKSPESLVIASYFQLLLQALMTIFSWNGFQMAENRSLLKEGLNIVASRIRSGGQTQMAFMDILRTAVQYVENFASTVPDISTAVVLLKLMATLTEKADSADLSRKLAKFAEEFLKRDWLGPDGQKEKGAKYNESLQTIIRMYLVNSEDPLDSADTLTSKGVPELIEADKNGASETYPTMNRWSFPVYYRVIFSELTECVKAIPLVKQSDSKEVRVEHFLRWNIAVRICHVLVSLIKTFDGRGNLGSALKYGRLFVDLFLRQGMPLLDNMFKSHRQDCLALLKNLQQSTRTMQHMCGHSKIIKDVALTNQVPMMKRSLEVFVYRVKVMLNLNNSLEAFWIGNLKNKDIHGEEILSQASTVTEVSNAGDDSGEEELPDDDNNDSDVEQDNQSNASNETNGDETDASYSQIY